MYKKVSLFLLILYTSAAYAYESNTIMDTIAGFDFFPYSLSDTVTGLNRPLSLALTPDGSRVYVTNLGNNSANVIDTSTNTLESTPNLNGIFNVPQSIAITPNGNYAYVASAGNGTVVVIDTDPTSGSYNSVIPEPALTRFDYPQSLAITPDGQYVYVANGNVNVVSTASNTITSTIIGFAVPDFIAITPNGDFAYVSNLFDGVSVIDIATNSIIPTPGLVFGFLFPQSITITPDGVYAYVANGGNTNSVIVIDIASNTIVSAPGLAGVFNGPVSIAFTPDGYYGYVSNSRNNTVSVIDTTSNMIIDTITGFSNPQSIVITSDGQYAYVTNVNNNTVSVLFIGVHMPVNLTGTSRKDIFLTQVDNYNHLTWSAPSSGNAPVVYQIYRDAGLTELVATVPASGILQYDDHNRNPRISYTYYIVSVDGSGNVSAPAVTTVIQNC